MIRPVPRYPGTRYWYPVVESGEWRLETFRKHTILPVQLVPVPGTGDITVPTYLYGTRPIERVVPCESIRPL